MSSVGRFHKFIQARDAAGLKFHMSRHMTKEPNITIEYRNTQAFLGACRDGSNEICEVLISFGANVSPNNGCYTAPLSLACSNAHPACVDLLLSHGADANVGDWAFMYYLSPLMEAVRYKTHVDLTLDEFIDNRCRCIRSLLTAGVTIDQTDHAGRTSLMLAAWNIRLTVILVEAGANMNILDNINTSVLHIACMRDTSVDVAEYFLERGADINAVTTSGITPLHYACTQFMCATVETLLCRGADIDIANNNGRTPLDLTLSNPSISANRVAVLQLIATCAQTRLEASSADWIRLARNERSRPQVAIGSMGTARVRRRRHI